jgi:iron(III) transport system permease protein
MYVAFSNYPPTCASVSALGMIVLIASLMGLVIQRYITGNRRKYETISGSESTETMRFNLKKYRWPIMFLAFGVLLALYVIPYLIIFLFSFQSGYGVTAQVTFANYERLLVGPLANSFYESYFNTLIVSGVGAFMAMTLSSMASYIIVKSKSNFGQVLDFVAMAPLAIPSIIIATAFLWFFLTYNVLGLFGTIWILILAMSVKLLVYGTRATNSAFNSVGTELEEIAELSGANFFQILRRVYIPLIKPGFFAGFLILFIDYTKMLTIPLFLSSADNSVMSTMIYNVGIQSNEQYGAALSVILSATLIALYLFAEFVLDIDVTRL